MVNPVYNWFGMLWPVMNYNRREYHNLNQLKTYEHNYWKNILKYFKYSKIPTFIEQKSIKLSSKEV